MYGKLFPHVVKGLMTMGMTSSLYTSGSDWMYICELLYSTFYEPKQYVTAFIPTSHVLWAIVAQHRATGGNRWTAMNPTNMAVGERPLKVGLP